MMRERQVVLVTGGSSGIGRAVASYLAGKGYTVFGTCRNPWCEMLDGFTLLPLDVTSDESVAACVDAVLRRGGRIDVLLNNAGADITGATEEITIDEMKWLFEVNFFGVVRMVKAVVPHMRAQGGGRIINVSSALGRVGLPFETSYVSTKHALEGFSESLRHEVKPFNIHVSVIEPGFFRSDIREQEREAANLMSIYAQERESVRRSFDHAVAQGADPAKVGRLVDKLIRMDSPGVRYPVLMEAHAAALGKRFAANRLFEKSARWIYELDDWRADVRRWAKQGGLVAAAVVAVLGAVVMGRRR